MTSKVWQHDKSGLGVLDTSALLANPLREPSAASCRAAMGHADELAISAAPLAEALIVADRRGDRPWRPPAVHRPRFRPHRYSGCAAAALNEAAPFDGSVASVFAGAKRAAPRGTTK